MQQFPFTLSNQRFIKEKKETSSLVNKLEKNQVKKLLLESDIGETLPFSMDFLESLWNWKYVSLFSVAIDLLKWHGASLKLLNKSKQINSKANPYSINENFSWNCAVIDEFQYSIFFFVTFSLLLFCSFLYFQSYSCRRKDNWIVITSHDFITKQIHCATTIHDSTWIYLFRFRGFKYIGISSRWLA